MALESHITGGNKSDDNTFYIYNTQSRDIEIFRPVEAGKAKIYVCGPTVNDVHRNYYGCYSRDVIFLDCCHDRKENSFLAKILAIIFRARNIKYFFCYLYSSVDL